MPETFLGGRGLNRNVGHDFWSMRKNCQITVPKVVKTNKFR